MSFLFRLQTTAVANVVSSSIANDSCSKCRFFFDCKRQLQRPSFLLRLQTDTSWVANIFCKEKVFTDYSLRICFSKSFLKVFLENHKASSSIFRLGNHGSVPLSHSKRCAFVKVHLRDLSPISNASSNFLANVPCVPRMVLITIPEDP